MSEDKDKGTGKPAGLRVDRLAEAIEAARARARGEARQPPAPAESRQPQAAGPATEPGRAGNATPPEDRSSAEPGRPPRADPSMPAADLGGQSARRAAEDRSGEGASGPLSAAAAGPVAPMAEVPAPQPSTPASEAVADQMPGDTVDPQAAGGAADAGPEDRVPSATGALPGDMPDTLAAADVQSEAAQATEATGAGQDRSDLVAPGDRTSAGREAQEVAADAGPDLTGPAPMADGASRDALPSGPVPIDPGAAPDATVPTPDTTPEPPSETPGQPADEAAGPRPEPLVLTPSQATRSEDDVSAEPGDTPLVLTPSQATAPPRDPRHQASRISAAIRRETRARRSAAELAGPPPELAPRRPARAALGPPLLTLDGVATDIGKYHILSDVSFEVPTGGVTMLLGRNGAGKTTTLRTIMGLWRAKAGSISLGGEDMARWASPRIARAGLGYVPEDMGIFSDLTVAENMALAARSGKLRDDRLHWIFATFPPLQTFWKSPAGVLSGGQKQMLSVARVMAEPRRVYLIDEPTKGLAPAIVATLLGALRDLKAQGATILLVEQNFAVARALGDRAVVMADGGVDWTGSMADLAADAGLQERLMGLSMEDGA